MIDQLYIAQLEKQYIDYLANIVLERPFQPITLRGGKNRPTTTAELHQLIKLFQANEKNEQKKGWNITWDEWSSKILGKQQWPSVLQVDTEDDFLYLIKKEKEVVAFKEQQAQLLQWNPTLRTWIADKPKLVLGLKHVWKGICAVVDYLLEHDVRGHYLRSIPVPVHTKFIEQHRKTILSILHHLNSDRFPSPDIDLEQALSLSKKPFLFKIRWLDENLSFKYTAGMNLFSAPVEYLQLQSWNASQVILVENETNLYLFPPLADTLVICSFGKALHLLKEIGFLHRTKLYYWGDMDEEGFVMLNDIRHYYSNTISLFMDDVTHAHHKEELSTRLVIYKKKELLLLHPHENRAYELLLNSNQWLEQERLQQSYVQGKLRSMIFSSRK